MTDALFDFSKCHYNNCRYDGLDLSEQTDVVLVNVDWITDDSLPKRRWPHQLYAAMTWEAPPNTRAGFLSNANLSWNFAFNLTFTYRRDADIFLPYGILEFKPLAKNVQPNYYEIAKRKTRFSAWLVSNCETNSKREDYIDQMQKYVVVDTYGGCGRPCKKDYCASVFTDYKFYLAFENSICHDYVTEKFFKVFRHDLHIVPVVRGGIDYKKYFPHDVFIDAADFKSPRDLAIYLKDLGKDLKRYSGYLERIDQYVWGQRPTAGCVVCEFLHTKAMGRKIYNMTRWMGDGQCVL
ncbi:alpha-(1,3)-fucosyltransferase C-like [Physella acuta]|uniref:alpha-(1,3)-fucosyltransferase C-like n=1 Tax=Physella acuta TaxID=109671 RepID=UPI0027DDC71A|nr:alpha-(1,3)-fucosyltransferase C-like [Physella acuta]